MSKIMTDLAIRLTANAAELKKGVNEANTSLKTIETNTSKIGKSITDSFVKMGAAMLAAFTVNALVSGIKQTLTDLGALADRLHDLSEITGVSTEKLQEWEYITKIAGVPTETYSKAVEQLTQRLSRGGEESATLSRGLNALGVSVRNSSGEIKNAGELSEEMIMKLADMEDGTKRNMIANQLFGGSWKDLAPILGLGSKGIEALRIEAHSLGAVLSNDALKAADDFRIATEKLATTWEGFRNNLVVQVFPSLTSFIEKLQLLASIDMNPLEKGTRILFGGFYRLLGMRGAANAFLDDLSKGIKKPLTPTQELQREQARLQVTLYAYQEKINLLNTLQEINGALTKEQADELAGYENEVTKIKPKLRTLADDLAHLFAVIAGENLPGTGNITRQLGIIESFQAELNKINQQILTATSNAEVIRLTALKKDLIDSREEFQKMIEDAATLKRYTDLLGGKENIIPVKAKAIPFSGFDIEQDALDLEFKEITIFDNAILAGETLIGVFNNMIDTLSLVTIATDGLNAGFDALFSGSTSGVKEFITQLIRLAQALFATALAEQIVAYVKSPQNVSTGGLYALGASVVGTAALAAIWKKTIPEFASGAVVYGETIAKVGEYPGARSNPEIIAPLSKLKTLIASENMMGGEVRFRIEQDALVGILRGARNKQIYF